MEETAESRLEDAPIPNTFAYLALYSWPAICLIFFVMLPVEAAAIWSLLAGFLLLPSATTVDVAMLPPLDKVTIPALATFLFCLMKGSQTPAPRIPALVYVFAFGFVIAPLFTCIDNSYELHIGDRSIPGFYPVDAVKLSLQNLITLMPFYIGSRYLSSEHGRALLLKAIPTAGLIYSLPMLVEIRLSPQLHTWVYGFFPGGFGQHYRAGGFRPVVFLDQGLELALFTAMALIGAVLAARLRWQLLRIPAGAAATYLAGLLLLCKTLGASLYGLISAPIVMFTTPRTWVRIACVITLIACAYPVLRTYNLIPVNQIASAANNVSADRKGSFETRIENEDKLLAKAHSKPFFGWGTWGRNRVFDEESGKDVSITDGAWIIRYGMFGWFGYLSLFGLFAASAFSARAAVRGPVTRGTVVLGGLTLLLAVNITDLIPNANLLPFTYLMAGSIAARPRARARSVRRWSKSAAVENKPALATSQ